MMAAKSKSCPECGSPVELQKEELAALIKCAECGQMMADKSKICPKCGCPVELQKEELAALIQCAECGQMMAAKSKSCPECGSPVESSPAQPLRASEPEMAATRPAESAARAKPPRGPLLSPKTKKVLKVCLIAIAGFIAVVVAATVVLYNFNDDFKQGFKNGYAILTGNAFTDADGNFYRTKIYNGVEWMVDNSRKTGVTDCTYSSIDRSSYGQLYSWNCAASACPDGWTLPTDDDFAALESALTAGGASAWADWNTGSSLAGYGNKDSYGGNQGLSGHWWSSSSSYSSWYGDGTGGGFNTYDRYYSFSVRCLKYPQESLQEGIGSGSSGGGGKTVSAATAANLLGTWISEENEMGYNFPELKLRDDGTASLQGGDDFVSTGTYIFSNNTVYFTGFPGGDNATEESMKVEETAFFVLKEDHTLATEYGTVLLKGGNANGRGITDADGHTYRTKVYGGVEWMIENSKKTTGVYGCYNNSISRGSYGRFYSWDCAHLACPSGWSLPSNADFAALASALYAEESASAWADWNFDSSLAGYGSHGSYYGYQNSGGYWWSSSSSNELWHVDRGNTGGGFATGGNSHSCSVRCRKSQ
jgi:uncharacterized protein (TIGR02145 family)